MQHKLLSREDENILTERERQHVGTYCVSGKRLNFDIDIDARPLALLIEEAGKGHRVYELQSIERPGDLLNYLWIHIAEESPELAQYVTEQHNQVLRFSEPQLSDRDFPFSEFDEYFPFGYDDTREDASLWLAYRGSVGCRQQLTRLLPVVKRAQAKLALINDFLTQHEIALMALGQHHLDFGAKVARDGQLNPGVPPLTTLPTDLFEVIVRLSRQESIQSVSCPFTDYWLWRELVTEQVRRSIAQGVVPRAALQLNGPDSGVPHVAQAGAARTDLEWGGEIHIPYEGACSADLFIQPKWFCFVSAEARVAPTLSEAVFGPYAIAVERTCTYLLTPWLKLGEIASAKRTVVGDWALYGPNSPE